jgi:hypothetical protein
MTARLRLRQPTPTVVYVPVYNPWTVYGSPLPMYPGYYYAPPAGVFWGGLTVGFGVGIGIGMLAQWGWGWGHWGIGWGSHSVFFNHSTYLTRSTTVINHGFNRPGGPSRNFAARGAYARSAGSLNRPGGGFNRPGSRGDFGANRPGGNYGRPGGAINRSSASTSRPTGGFNGGYRGAFGMNRPGGNYGTSRWSDQSFFSKRQPARWKLWPLQRRSGCKLSSGIDGSWIRS